MSGYISTTVAPQSSILAQTQHAATSRPAVPQNASQVIAQNATVISGQAAAVVSLGNRKGRGVSSGENKAVDAAFEKQEASEAKARSKDESSEDEKGKAGTLVNVSA